MKHRYRAYLHTALFTWLLACQSWPLAAQERGAPLTVPFQFVSHQILLSVQVNGSGPYNMLLDSGTDPSAIDIELARTLGLELTAPTASGTGAGEGSVDVIPTSIESLQVGEFAARDISALAVDLSALGNKLGKPLHGVLGYSLLQNRIVEIDYPQRQVRFLNPSDAAEAATSLPMLFAREDNIPVFEGLKVNGVPLLTALDTGSSRTLTLYPPAVARLEMDEQAAEAGSSASGEGFAGSSSYRAIAAQSVEIDSITFGPREVFALTTGNRMATADFEPLANLGNGLLQYCVLRLDYRNRRIGLRDCQVAAPGR